MRNQNIVTIKILTLFLSSVLLLASCDDDDAKTDKKPLEVPSTYNFENVSYDGQVQRIMQLTELSNYITSSIENKASIDATRLQAMYENDAANANWMGTYDESKELKGKTFEPHQQLFVDLLNALATASESTTAATDSTAGLISSNDGSKTYLFNENGVELYQLVQKGLMGSCFLYQISAVYTGEGKMNVDNTNVEPGVGTAMEHHWDEAFGYYGVPKDFPSNTDNAIYWGKYSIARDAALNCNDELMGAFLKGRAAISANELAVRDEAITEVRTQLDQISAASAIYYLKNTIEIQDAAIRGHNLSEAVAFIHGLYFNPEGMVTKDQIDALINELGGSSDIRNIDLYQTTDQDITSVIDQLAGLYNITESELAAI